MAVNRNGLPGVKYSVEDNYYILGAKITIILLLGGMEDR